MQIYSMYFCLFMIAKFLGGGIRGNVLVPYDIPSGLTKFDYIGTRKSNGLLKSRVICNLYLNNVLVRRFLSEIVHLTDSGLGTISFMTYFITYIHIYAYTYIHTYINTHVYT